MAVAGVALVAALAAVRLLGSGPSPDAAARPVPKIDAAAWVSHAPRRAAPPLRALASSSAPRHPPALAMDGRSAGALPSGWRAAGGDTSPWLALRFRQPVELSAVLARGVGADAAAVQLTLDGRGVVAPVEVAPGKLLFLLPEAGARASEVRLSGAPGVEEVVPVLARTRTWILEGARAEDWTREIFRGHGLRPVGALPLARLAAMLERAPQDSSLILPEMAIDDATRAALRGWAEKGATLLELGPESGVCGQSASAGGETPVDLVAADGARHHFVGLPAPHTACAQCTRGEVLLSTEGEAPMLVAERLGAGRCLRWLHGFASAQRRLRQGAAARADVDGIGGDGFQPADLFVGDLRPPDYAAPHADRLVEATISALAPAQRLHLLPPAPDGVVILSADQDYVPDDGVIAQFAEMGGHRATLLMTDATVGAAPDVDFGDRTVDRLGLEAIARLQQSGHSGGIHPNVFQLPTGPSGYGSVIEEHARRFAAAYGARPRIVRNHHVVWKGYVEMAELHARAGLVMNLDFMALAYRGKGALGFLNGSALPLRFAAADGTVLPIYQQGTQLDDHVLLPPRFGYEPLGVAGLTAAHRRLFEAAAGDDPHPIVVNHHPVWWFETGGEWLRNLLADARAQSLAVWDCARWLSHVEALRETVVVPGQGGSLRVLTGDTEISLLLPEHATLSADGQPVPTRHRRVGGRTYTWATLGRSSDVALEVKR